MPFNSVISRTDASPLIPVDISNEILSNVAKMNPILQLARRLPNMSVAQRRLPVMSALATAYFVAGDTGLKQTSEVNWENKYIDAEELAVIVPIPEAVLDDSSFDVWAQVRPEIETAISVAITHALLYGTNIPASWTTNLGAAGILALCVAASLSAWLPTPTSTRPCWAKPLAGLMASLWPLRPTVSWSPAILPTPA
jgi:HK97 family phage major capsid protein